MKKLLSYLAFSLFVCSITLSCKKTELPIKTSGPEFSLDSFERNIINALDGKTVGYTYSISVGGIQKRKGAGGYAVAPWDIGGNILHSPSKRQEIASCSKTITALALLSILQEKGYVSTSSYMYTYLPKSWNITNNSLKKITLADLLKHESGMAAGGIGYNDVRARALKTGTYIRGSYDYQNINYAFLRTVIAFLSPTADLFAYEKSLSGSTGGLSEEDHKLLDSAISKVYIDEVNKRVFSPTGIPYTTPTAYDEQNPTKNYSFLNKEYGYFKGDMIKYVGSTGWRLSAVEQNALMATLKHTNKILNNDWKTKMNENLLGWATSSQQVTGGMAYMHGGYHEDKYGMPDKKPAQALGRGCFAVHVIFPNNVECALQVNSLGGTNNMESTVVPCYENAWIEN